jgi:glyoxylate/succinic semialdehyde reductase
MIAPSASSPRPSVAATAMSPCEPGRTKIGFVGLGILGVPMTKRLLSAGYDVSVYNRNRDKCREVEGANCKVCSSPREVVEASDITFATLSDPDAAIEVALGANGIVEGMGPGKGYCDVSTVDAACSQKISEAIKAKGGMFLEAPVSGSKGPAEQGKLVFLTAGSRELFDAASPALDVMGKARHFLGEVGAGAKMKLVVNQIMGNMMVAWAEGMNLAEKSNLKTSDLIQVVSEGAIACPMFALKGPLMAQGSFAPAFPLKHQQKDLRLALELAAEVKADMPTTAAANAVYLKALSESGDEDFSAVIKKIQN